MANVKITELPAVVTITPASDVIPLVSGGATKKATPTQMVNSVLNGAGSVGIGTSSPSGKLDVVGTLGTVSINVNGDQISYNNNGFNYLTVSGATATLQIQASGASGKLLLSTAGTERMRIDSAGNVGIGTTSIGEKFVVNGAIQAKTGAVSALNANHVGYTFTGDTDTGVFNPVDGTLDLAVNGSVHMSFSGTNAILTHGLVMRGGTGGEGGQISLNNIANTNTAVFLDVDGVNEARLWGVLATDMLFGTNNTERMRIDASGKVGIGVSIPSEKLQVAGAISSTSTITEVHTNTAFQYKYSASEHNAFYKKTSSTYSYYFRTSDTGLNGGANEKQLAVFNNDYISLYTTNIERLRIDSSGNVGIGTSTIASRLSIKGTTATDAPTLGTEFITGGTWTSTGWTGDNTTGWVNGASNTTPLSYSVAAVTATKYQITYTVTSYSAGSFTVAFGGQSFSNITTTGAFGPTTTTTGNLVITPTATFVGTIIISIKAITAESTALMTGLDSSGATGYEVRASSSVGNTFFGLLAGRYITTATQSTAFGASTLRSCTTGVQNTAFGNQSLQNITTGSNNTAVGVNSFQNLLTGSNNIAVGVAAGKFIADGTTALTAAASSTYLGYQTKASADNVINETVVGFNAIGSGTNTITLGGSAVTGTNIPYGSVGIGATASVSAILDVQSTTKGVRFPNMTTTQKTAVATPAAGLVVFDTTLAKLCVYSGAAWQTITSV